MSLTIEANTPAAQALQTSIQSHLASRGWADKDDEVMAEYVVVMLSNSKSVDQVTAEMEEIIGNDFDPRSFGKWLEQEMSRGARDANQRDVVGSSGSSSREAPEIMESTRRGGTDEQRRSRSPKVERRKQELGYDQGPFSGERRRSRSPQRSTFGRRADTYRPGAAQDRNRRFDFSNGQSRDDYYRSGPGLRAWGGQDHSARDQQYPHEHLPGRGNRTAMDSPAFASMPAVRQPPQSDEDAAMMSSSPPTGPRHLRVRGAAGAGGALFARAMAGAPHQDKADDLVAQPAPSILSRFAVPDPRAGVFEPAQQTTAAQPAQHHVARPGVWAPQTSTNGSSAPLLHRLDPMLPNNQFSSSDAMSVDEVQPAQHSSDWPSQPASSGLCRYGLQCTNPMCSFAHPSPSAASAKGGPAANAQSEDPLVLDPTPCKFQASCTKRDCSRSHVSPAQLFLGGRNNASGSTLSVDPSQTPCKFQAACTNAKCAYAHFDPNTGAAGPSPAALTLATASTTPADFSPANVPCKFGSACTRADCKFAHTQARDEPSGGDAKCRFGAGCTRADCRFAHPLGRAIDIAGYSGLSNGSIGARPIDADTELAARRTQRFGVNSGSGQSSDAPLKDEDGRPGIRDVEDDDIELVLPGSGGNTSGTTERRSVQPVA
ncbi:Nuclear polyadenylated RNA binding protein [Ceraceosorus bombacis]|uniref:Nuclear polyadenylated RNA binding protein n=1 Tax=Ceraceosorus bombacis TaxID=401625 RepID=A0A0P1B739_9BASI|nr:Nuclear polyadenylated RNA binding protein [Ceraceosorus bombacis]